MLYSLDEICLIPATTTSIKHRSDVKVNYDNAMLPIFTAPMACIVDGGNYLQFVNKGINTIIPRSVHWSSRMELARSGNWIAVGLSEAKYIYESSELVNIFTYTNPLKICIDQANGHMKELINLCKDIKNRFGQQVIIMTGNIANPYTYDEYALAGVDYVRIGIGGGSRCTTSVQTGIHYPMGSLIYECNNRRKIINTNIKDFGLDCIYKSVPKIIADGGINHIDHIVKALALGADYVMLGKMLAKTNEACGMSQAKEDGDYREYFGMSTEKAQRLVNNAARKPFENFNPKHTEGTNSLVKITGPLNELVYDITHALRSSMSYCNAYNLESFVGKVKFDTMTTSSFSAYIK